MHHIYIPLYIQENNNLMNRFYESILIDNKLSIDYANGFVKIMLYRVHVLGILF